MKLDTMHVLLVSGEYPPMRGGIGDYTYHLARALRATGINVSILCGKISSGQPNAWPVYRQISRWDWRCWSIFETLIREHQPDWLHIQYHASMYDHHPAICLLPYWLRLRKRGVRLAVTMQSLLRPYLFPKAGYLRWLSLVVLVLGCDAVVTTNWADYRRLQFARRGNRLLRRIPLGSAIQPVQLSPDERDKMRDRLGLSPNDFVIAHFGTRDGLSILVEAVKQMLNQGQPVHLLLIGKSRIEQGATDREYVGQLLEERISEPPLAQHVHCTGGYLPARHVSLCLSAADAVALPYQRSRYSLVQNSGLVAAIVHGLPVVTTFPTVEVPELENDHHILMVPRNDPSALAAALQRLAMDTTLREQLSQGALELAGSFAWEVIARDHLALYTDLDPLDAGSGEVA